MFKSVYDVDNDGVVDNSEKLEGSTKAQVQDHVPQAHTLASHSTKAHSELTDVTSNQHHAQLHKVSHLSGGADAFVLADLLDCLARLEIKKAGTSISKRRGLNLIEGANVTLTVADDPTNEEVDVTIASAGGGGGVHNVQMASAIDTITRGAGTYVDVPGLSITMTLEANQKVLIMANINAKHSASGALFYFGIGVASSVITDSIRTFQHTADYFVSVPLLWIYQAPSAGDYVFTVMWAAGAATLTATKRNLVVISF